MFKLKFKNKESFLSSPNNNKVMTKKLDTQRFFRVESSAVKCSSCRDQSIEAEIVHRDLQIPENVPHLVLFDKVGELELIHPFSHSPEQPSSNNSLHFS